MTRVTVRSQALREAAERLSQGAEAVRGEAASLASSATRCPGLAPDVRARLGWLAGPAGLWGEGLALDVLATRLRAAAAGYEEVERAVAAVLRAVGAAADAGGRVGVLDDGALPPVVDEVEPRWRASPLDGPADLVALGRDLDEGRVRVVEVEAPAGGSAWVVVVPGTQEWSPVPGANPFDLTSDVRAVTGDATVAAAGVAVALERAKARAGRGGARGARDPVLLVGHSQGGIHAAALAADPGFRGRHHVTHVLTSGAPVALFPIPREVHVLSVERASDPVPTLDLTPNPAHGTWRTVRVGTGPATDTGSHALGRYAASVRAAQEAPFGSVPELMTWQVGAAAFLHRPVRSVTEAEVRRVRPSAPRMGRM